MSDDMDQPLPDEVSSEIPDDQGPSNPVEGSFTHVLFVVINPDWRKRSCGLRNCDNCAAY